MRYFKIKLNKSTWPKWFTDRIRSVKDPTILYNKNISSKDFTEAVSELKFGSTYKTTKKFRFPLTVEYLKRTVNNLSTVILDVGASDGSSSLHILNSLSFSKYFITDLNIELFLFRKGLLNFFYDSSGKCILIVSKFLIFFPVHKDLGHNFDKLMNFLVLKENRKWRKVERIELINPRVTNFIKNNDKVIVCVYNIFKKWNRQKVNLVIAANILNKSYFTDRQIERALANIYDSLQEKGRLAVVDSRLIEMSTVFIKSHGRFQEEFSINGGTEIKKIVLKFPY